MVSRVFFGSLMAFTLISFVPPGAGKEVVDVAGSINGKVPVVVREGVTDIIRDIAKKFLPDKKRAKEIAQEEGVSFFYRLIGWDNHEEKNRIWRAVSATDASPTIQMTFEKIEQARKDGDAQPCLALEFVEESGRPSRGDWIAYCLARVNQEIRRCDQIAGDTNPPLSRVCYEELQ